MQKLQRSNNNFDFLRLFAAVCICFTHSFYLLQQENAEPLSKLTNSYFDFSIIGLSIFFTISGYLIYHSASTSSLKQFAWKRLLRIQPLLIVMCLVLVIAGGIWLTSLSKLQYFSTIETYTYFRNILPIFGAQFTLPQVFINNIGESGVNGSIWTLVVEERLYAIIALFFVFKNYRDIIFRYIIIAVNIIYLAHIFIFDNTLIPYLNGRHIIYMLMFLNGALMYNVKVNFFQYAKQWLIWLVAIVFLIITIKIPAIQKSIFIPFIILLFAHKQLPLNKAGKWGDFTYGVYLFSFPVQQIIIFITKNQIKPYTLFALTMLICFPIAIISWHFFEKKILQYKTWVK
jgi:peptidoglycan/LPS O-acetylase OafA/YrhL